MTNERQTDRQTEKERQREEAFSPTNSLILTEEIVSILDTDQQPILIRSYGFKLPRSKCIIITEA